MSLQNRQIVLLIIVLKFLSGSTGTTECPNVNSDFVANVINFALEKESLLGYIMITTNGLEDIAADIQLKLQQMNPLFPHILLQQPRVSKSDNKFNSLGNTQQLNIVLVTSFDKKFMNFIRIHLPSRKKSVVIINPLKNCYDDTQIAIDKYFAHLLEYMHSRVFVLTAKNHIFAREKHHLYRIKNITNSWRNDSLFTKLSGVNLDRHTVRAYAAYDQPNLFIMPERFKNNDSLNALTGINGKIVQTILVKVNATLNLNITRENYKLPEAKYKAVVNKLKRNEIDLSLNSFIAFLPLPHYIPLHMYDWCIMTPDPKDHSHETRSLLWSIDINGQAFYAILVITFTYVDWLCAWKEINFDLGLSFLQRYCTLLNLPHPKQRRTQKSARIMFLFFLCYIYGLFNTSCTSTQIVTDLTKESRSVPILTIEQVVRKQLQIMMLEFEYKFLNESNISKTFLKQIIVVDEKTLQNHRNKFNTTYGYSVTQDTWNFLNVQQKYLPRPRFYLSNICFGSLLYILPVKEHSFLETWFKRLFQLTVESGLKKHFEAMAFMDALYLKQATFLKPQEYVKPLPLTYYIPLLLIWFFGISMSFIVFILEIEWKDEEN